MNYSTPGRNCPNCGGDYKISTSEYIVKSRDSAKNKMVIENLDVLECKICGSTEFTEESEYYIQLIRKKISEEMKKKSFANQYGEASSNLSKETNAPQNSIGSLKNFFKKIIG